MPVRKDLRKVYLVYANNFASYKRWQNLPGSEAAGRSSECRCHALFKPFAKWILFTFQLFKKTIIKTNIVSHWAIQWYRYNWKQAHQDLARLLVVEPSGLYIYIYIYALQGGLYPNSHTCSVWLLIKNNRKKGHTSTCVSTCIYNSYW